MPERNIIDEQCDLFHVTKPYRYIGGEYYSANKQWDKNNIRIAFAFPDKYEIAISNLGQRMLYGIVNNHENWLADRVYAPDTDYMQILKSKNALLKTLEAKKNIKDFDIVAFSLHYELAYPTVLQMLKMSDIPLMSKDRDNTYPLICAGGPCTFNPMPVADFFDFFLIGDGEDLITDIMNKVEQLKNKNLSKDDILREFSKIDGIYVPRINNHTKKRVSDLSNQYNYLNPVPYSSSVHDRTIIEIRRGCGRMCRFCQAGYTNLPIRERKAEDIIKLVKNSVQSCGYEEYSLLSLSSNDYTNIEPVIEQLSSELNSRKISVSLPSQRIDRYNLNLAKLVQGVRASTVTLAPEAGSQRLRNVINKNLTEDQIIETILTCYKSGSSSIKLYFMIGLPTETYEDIDGIYELLSKIKYRASILRKELSIKDTIKITCTLSIFVPKPFTPFQWYGQDSITVLADKIHYLLDKVKQLKNVKINYHDSFTTKLETFFARGNRNLSKYLIALNNNDVYLSSWEENIDKDLWTRLANECDIDIDKEAQKVFSVEETLPWDNIDTGVNKSWLINEYTKSQLSESTNPCEFGCTNCGVCNNLNTKRNKDNPYNPVINKQNTNKDILQKAFKYRLKLTKMEKLRYISHLDWQNTLIKMLFRSGLDLCFSQGFNPTPKISLGIALPIFVESICEYIDIEIYNDIEPQKLKDILQKCIPQEIEIKEIKKISNTIKSIDVIAQWAKYEITSFKKGILNFDEMLYIKNVISSNTEICIEKINKKGIKKFINIRPSIKSAEVENDTLTIVLKTGQNQEIPSVRPDDFMKYFYPDVECRIIRTGFYDENLNEL